MSVSVLDMSVSLDGFIAGPDDFLGGADGQRLHDWFAPDGEFTRPSGPAGAFLDEWNATGAVLAGRRTAELMDHWGGDHAGAPIFVPSHRPPGPAARWGYPLVTYVTDGIEAAMAQAKAAAGNRDVQVRGGYTAQTALEAGVLDEVQIHHARPPGSTHIATRRTTMSKIVNSTFVSLDGVINHMDRWHFDFVDAESDAVALQQLTASSALLMGRHTYEVYASVWPGRGGDYADKINAMDKYVASTTLASVDWAHTTILDGDVIEAVTTLKRTPGADILMHGYGPVAKTLLGHGLLDELHLWVHPQLAGVGGPGDLLLGEGLNTRLDLMDVTRLTSGVVILSYRIG